MPTILITGATGTIGTNLIERLAREPGITVRAAVRSAGKADALRQRGVTPVDFDFEQPTTMATALAGVDRAFLLAPAIRDQVGASTRFVELAKAAGVRHVVKLSAFECDHEPTIQFGRAHLAVERVLAASGLAWTFLRPNNFMENFLGIRHGAFAPDGNGAIRLPWGTAACSFIAADDIAAVAARALVGEGHAGKVYELTGPEALRLDQIAEQITAATGRMFRYIDIPEAEARRGLVEAHLPPPMVDGVLELHALGKAGRAAGVTGTVAEVTGTAARDFRTFARAHVASWSAR